MKKLHSIIFCIMFCWSMATSAWAQSYDVDVDFDLDEFKSDYLADTEFMKGDSSKTTLREFRGKPVVLTFWGTWCPPCVAEMPYLDGLAAELGDKVNMVTLAESQDGKASPYTLIKDVKDFMERKKIKNLDVYVDMFGQVFAMFEAGTSIPTTIVLDENGNEKIRHPGALGWHSKEFKKQLMEVVDAAK